MVACLQIACLVAIVTAKGSGGGGPSSYSYSSRASTRTYSSRSSVVPYAGGGLFVYSTSGRRYGSGRSRKQSSTEEYVFECENGNKIDGGYVCDLVDDCGDGSDERSPTPCSGKCSAGERLLHGMLLLALSIWFCICVHHMRPRLPTSLPKALHTRGRAAAVGIAIPVFVQAFSMLIILSVCAGEDLTQEINMNIVLLVFAGLPCFYAPCLLLSPVGDAKERLARLEREFKVSKEAASLEASTLDAVIAASRQDAEELNAAIAASLATQTAQPATKTMQVQVPPGAGAGTTIQVQTPDGLLIQLVVPREAGYGGATFMAQYTAVPPPPSYSAQTQPGRGGRAALPNETDAMIGLRRQILDCRELIRAMRMHLGLLFVWFVFLIALAAVPSPFASAGEITGLRERFTSASLTANPTDAKFPVANLAEVPLSPPLGGGKVVWRAPAGSASAYVQVDLLSLKPIVMVSLQQDINAPTMNFTISASNYSEPGGASNSSFQVLAAGELKKTASKNFLDIYIPSVESWRYLRLNFAKAPTSGSAQTIGLNELNVFTGSGDQADREL